MPGRPRTPLGEWGDINTRRLPSGRYQARARYRAMSGRLIQVTASGTSASAAKRSLIKKLKAGVHDTRTGLSLTPQSTISELCHYWLKHHERPRPQTLYEYKNVIRCHIDPKIGDMCLSEVTPGSLSAFLDTLPHSRYWAGRSILQQSLGLALGLDLIPHSPIANLPTRHIPTKPVEVLTPQQVAHLRAGLTQWVNSPRARTDRQYLLDFFDLMLATGCRPSELCALHWDDVDLEATPPTVLINATTVKHPGKPTQRQESTKTGNGRLLILPPYAVQTLTLRAARAENSAPGTPIFPGPHGESYLPYRRLCKHWNMARRAAGGKDPTLFENVTFQMLRRTVATLIDECSGDTEAAAQLGHTSTKITHRHYIRARAAQAPDLTEILSQLHTEPSSREDGPKVVNK